MHHRGFRFSVLSCIFSGFHLATVTTDRFRFINDDFYSEKVAPSELDSLLADGWRHFGPNFFRYNLAVYEDEIRRVMPLRIRLSEFRLSKSQRRILKRNDDLTVNIEPIGITAEVEALFHRHKQRFKQHPPESIYTFVSECPELEPCTTLQQSIRTREGKLLSAGFFDKGENSLSGIYTAFEPTEGRRSLGIFTILKEIEYAISLGKEFYYQGYCYSGSSFYDYKKRFLGTEVFDWNGGWKRLDSDL